jgi:enoyl-CoA hydratase/carnithine racemase
MPGDVLCTGAFQMPTSDHATASLPDDPALLSIEGPIATIRLNRPAAFNSIDLSIARKLEQLGAEVEANDDIRVLVIEGEGRAFRRSANHRRRCCS